MVIMLVKIRNYERPFDDSRNRHRRFQWLHVRYCMNCKLKYFYIAIPLRLLLLECSTWQRVSNWKTVSFFAAEKFALFAEIII
jgi:hypothetical protein